MSKQNKLVVAAAGSGKTTLLAEEANAVAPKKVLITTYTEANGAEIKRKLIKRYGLIPSHITIQTWFSFLIQHGVKPYQGTLNSSLFEKQIHGMFLIQEQSGVKFISKQGNKTIKGYWAESDFLHYYFTKELKLYSDKISKFVVKSNEVSKGNVIDRLSRIYSHLYVDEVQDLAGWDLEFLILLFNSPINITMVGDPRQVTYLTHHDKKHSGYKDGRIKEFLADKCKKISITVDETTLKYSHRNNAEICAFSSKLYPALPKSEPCTCEPCRSRRTEHEGIFLVKEKDIKEYKARYSPIVLRYQNSEAPEWNYGKSKGLGFPRVLIYPTKKIIQYLNDGVLTETKKGKTTNRFDIAKFYVAVTRAENSVAIVHNYADDESFIEGVQKWQP
jgi:DNA helicase-2/ATP-dependent DNA helicase PcrA